MKHFLALISGLRYAFGVYKGQGHNCCTLRERTLLPDMLPSACALLSWAARGCLVNRHPGRPSHHAVPRKRCSLRCAAVCASHSPSACASR